MKKIITCIVIVSALLTFNPGQSKAATEVTTTTTPVPNAEDVAKVQVMVNRLHEIDAMDKSNMSASEKKVLRKEVRGIKRDIERASGGVYLSVGALLLVIILLIVLL